MFSEDEIHGKNYTSLQSKAIKKIIHIKKNFIIISTLKITLFCSLNAKIIRPRFIMNLGILKKKIA